MHQIATVLVAVFCLRINAHSEEEAYCDGSGSTINCRSHHEISALISSLRKEVKDIRSSVDPNCTVCWSAPCKNNGQCVPLTYSEFRCDCPPDYSGKVCEKHLECKPDSCGANAICYIANHQVNCVCKQGFTGDPRTGCSLKKVRACMDGDPHYATFDGQTYEYMGTCPYFFLVPCAGALPQPYGNFAVKAKNELSFAGAHVSTVNEAEVVMYDQVVHFDRSFNLYFNGVRTGFPFYYPDRANAKISVTSANSEIRVTDDRYIVVSLTSSRLCVEIPDVPEIEGQDVLCGLAGNRDSNCTNDFRFKDGYTYTNVTSCGNHYVKFTEVFGDTYITTDFFAVTGSPKECLKGVEVVNGSISCPDLAVSREKCKPIQQAIIGNGTFAVCAAIGANLIQDAFENCVFDHCQREATLCSSMESFVKMCQRDLPNTPISWRIELQCPALHCPQHASPSLCATGCPLTCDDPVYKPECNNACTEGCECEPGYVLENHDPKNPRCVYATECGCKDALGNYYPEGKVWLARDCAIVNVCHNGTITSERKPCSVDATCEASLGEYSCKCKKGYEGDGYHCSDVDECLDPKTCSAGLDQGICTNSIGSYICQCDIYYDDHDNCETYLPLRHCADLRKYHNIANSGVYELKPSYEFRGLPKYSVLKVYCDMTMDGGGWTLIADSNSNSMSDKTFAEYEFGFGDPNIQDLWIGLDILNKMTTEVKTSLLLDLYRCGRNNKPPKSTNCTYSEFKVLDSSKAYAVVIPEACEGTEDNYDDGWKRWETEIGPRFVAFDTDQSECAKYFLNTGWWFDTENLCGPANLNGKRYSCENPPPAIELESYLKYNGNVVNKAHLYLRPADFPDFEAPAPAKILTHGKL